MATQTTIYDKQDIQRAAYSMISNHGRHAAEIAMRRAANLGDSSFEARRTWERIVSAIDEIQHH